MPGKILLLALMIVFGLTFSGCWAGGLLGQVIHEGNDEYDNIIVNMGYKYKTYRKNIVESNNVLIAKGRDAEDISPFCEWIKTQIHNVKEKKAVARYIKNNGCS